MMPLKRLRNAAALVAWRKRARLLAPLAAVIILGAIALAHPSSAWASALASVAAASPLAMIVAARYGSAARRPARYGFALCCGAYFLFFAFFTDNAYLDNFVTSQAIDLYYKRSFPDSLASPLPSPTYLHGGFGGGGAFEVDTPSEPSPTDSSRKSAVPIGSSSNGGVTPDSVASSTRTAALTPLPPARPPQPTQDDEADAANFWVIGHSLWALLFGWVGGCLAAFLAAKERKASNPQDSPVAART